MAEYSTFWDRCDALPPILIRLLAKAGNDPLTTDQIAGRSGLPVERIRLIQQQTDWRGVDLLEMKKFLTGCDRDFTEYATWKRIRNYISNPGATFKYLRRSPEFDQVLSPLSDAWTRHCESLAEADAGD